MSTLTPGVATAGAVGKHSIAVSATPPTGGTAPYSYRWQYQWPRGSSSWVSASGTGVTTLNAIIRNLGPAARYLIRLQYTDAVLDVAESNTLTISTRSLGWFPGLSGRTRRDH